MIEKGLLPENLPPIISSKLLWQHLEPLGPGYAVTAKRVGRVSPYNASKRGFQRRLFGLPHPLFIYDQATFFERHWREISAAMSDAVGSLSRPSFPTSGPRSTRITAHSELPKARLQAFSRYRHCLVTDVSRCFPSIYTHSIPWALHGKVSAKEDTKSSSAVVFGNRLDFAIRQGQDQQTIGIPVGPDTSRVVSELILSAVDKEFLRRSGRSSPTYRRHVDDYWVGGNSIEECERHLQTLREAMREFELDINELKTRIVNTSVVFGDSWASEIETDIERAFPQFTRPTMDQIAVLGRIVERARTNSDDGVIRHAIRKLDEKKSWNPHWGVLSHFLAQCAVQFPHSFDYVARVVAWRLRRGEEVDKELWLDVTRVVLAQGASLGRDSEAIWSLWLLKELRGRVTTHLSESVIQNNSPIVVATLAHLHAHGLTTDRSIKPKMWSSVEGNHFAGSYWPLTLELNALQIPKPPNADDGGGDDVLRRLHAHGASLIDWNAAPAVFERPPNRPAWAGFEEPDSAIEDYTSDYDSDDDDDDSDDDDGFSDLSISDDSPY